MSEEENYDTYIVTVEYEVQFSPEHDHVKTAFDVKKWVEKGGDLGLESLDYYVKKIVKKKL